VLDTLEPEGNGMGERNAGDDAAHKGCRPDLLGPATLCEPINRAHDQKSDEHHLSGHIDFETEVSFPVKRLTIVAQAARRWFGTAGCWLWPVATLKTSP